MTKHRLFAALIAIVLLALIVVTMAPQNDLVNKARLNDLSGKTITNDYEYCSVPCENKFSYEKPKFIYAQPNNPTNFRSYSIHPGDYFPVIAESAQNEIITIYQYKGLIFNDPKSVAETSPFEFTDNYVKLSLVYAVIKDKDTSKSETLNKFTCNGKQVLVPIPGRSKSPFLPNGRLGKSIGNYGSLVKNTNMFRFAEVKIYPFRDAGINDKDLFNYYYKPQYARASIVTIGGDPAAGSAQNVKDSRLLVDVDNDGDLGGDSSTGYSYTNFGICDQNVHTGIRSQNLA